MKRLIILLCLLFMILPISAMPAQEKPLKEDDLLKIRNYELSIQNLKLQMDILNRDIGRLSEERNNYINQLYKDYGLNKEWRIDLEMGVWFLEKDTNVEAGEMGTKK